MVIKHRYPLCTFLLDTAVDCWCNPVIWYRQHIFLHFFIDFSSNNLLFLSRITLFFHSPDSPVRETSAEIAPLNTFPVSSTSGQFYRDIDVAVWRCSTAVEICSIVSIWKLWTGSALMLSQINSITFIHLFGSAECNTIAYLQ